MHRRALEGKEQVLGGHTSGNVVIHISNPEGCLRSMGRYDEALPLYRRVLAGREQELGAAHIAFTHTQY